MNGTMQAVLKLNREKEKELSPKQGGRGTMHKDQPRDKVVRIRSDLFNEMSTSKLGSKFNVDFDDIMSEVWDFYKKQHKEK